MELSSTQPDIRQQTVGQIKMANQKITYNILIEALLTTIRMTMYGLITSSCSRKLKKLNLEKAFKMIF